MDSAEGWLKTVPHIKLSTKSKTLEDLAPLIKRAKILPLRRYSLADYRLDEKAVVASIQASFEDLSLIVRSSATAEDNIASSNAGHFRSVLNIPTNDADALKAAIDDVIASYGVCCNSEEFFVQPMLHGMTAGGVVFTSDIYTLAPYYIINYDLSGRSDTITGGYSSPDIKTYIHFKHAPQLPKDSMLSRVCEACAEIEDLSGNPCLDIEFALNESELFILQVRPITTNGKENLSHLDLKDALSKIFRKIEKLSAPHPNLLGNKVIFGVMPDWNPAEIIGLKPRQLALSLYKELVTDSVWAYQRDNYGYRNLRSHPLLVSFLGMPFVDVRVDFNSFIPKKLDDGIAAKLADYYIKRLDNSPELHDKVEFEIVHSCYYLTLAQKLETLKQHGFNSNEIKRIEFALLELTNQIIDTGSGLYKKDLQRVKELATNHSAIMNSDLTAIEKIYWLVEYCKRYGTLPFAGVARAAFIAIQFLMSFVEAGIMTQEEHSAFMNSLNTVTKQLQTALCGLQNGEISRQEFLGQFGHLRPGTYDILSPCYDEGFDHYFPGALRGFCHLVPEFSLSDRQKRLITQLLKENGIKAEAEGLLAFMVEAIEGREYAKLLFTRTLSDVLRLVREMGEQYGVEREDISYLDIRTVLALYSQLDHRNLKDILLSDIAIHKELYSYTKAVKLPVLIREPTDVYGFFLEPESPNFITTGRVLAETIAGEQVISSQLSGRIVFIQAADPGYDYLFTRNIVGLVTQFGGANSHMSIRCAELGIPAIIGAGEKNYSEWSQAKMLEIDCANRQVRVIA